MSICLLPSTIITRWIKRCFLFFCVCVDLDASRELVKEFQEVLNEHNGSRPILIAEVEGPYERTSKYYEVSDIPFNFGLINKLNEPGLTLSQNINKTVLEYIASIPNGTTPNWVIGNHDQKRVGSRVGKDKRHAMNALVLTLPGVVTTYYGEEIGMLNGNIASLSDPRDNARTPMQWNKEANAGKLLYSIRGGEVLSERLTRRPGKDTE